MIEEMIIANFVLQSLLIGGYIMMYRKMQTVEKLFFICFPADYLKEMLKEKIPRPPTMK